MSLFGGTSVPNAQPTQSTGFGGFGAAATTTSSGPGQSLFGSIGAPKPANTGSSLFGTGTGLNTPVQSQPTATTSGPGLFGGLTTPKPPTTSTPGLFGGLRPLGGSLQGQQPANTTSQSNLFSGLGNHGSAQTQQSNPSSLFASIKPSTQPQAQSISTAASQPSQFTQQQQQQQPLGGSLSQSTSTPSQSAYFDHLLERGRKRNIQENGGNQLGDLPSLQLGLGDIARKVRNLGTGGPSAPQARDSRAHYLLAASGVSTGAALRDLNSVGVHAGQNSTYTSSDILDTDIEGYIANLHSQSTLALISEGIEQSKRDFDAFLEENVQLEWDAQRKRIYEHFGLVKPVDNVSGSDVGIPDLSHPSERGAFGRSMRRGRGVGASTTGTGNMTFNGSGINRSILGTPSIRNQVGIAEPLDKSTQRIQGQAEDRLLRDKQEQLAEKIAQMNRARHEEQQYHVLKELGSVEDYSGSDNTARIADAYRALIEITEEGKGSQDSLESTMIKERQYASKYLDEHLASRASVEIRKLITNGSLRFLEKHFFERLETSIAKNPREAYLGGVPTTVNKVRAYIRLKFAQKELVDEGTELGNLQMIGDDYCWATIFYLLRSGLVREALGYVTENERAIKSIDRHFPQYIAAYAKDSDRRLPPDLQNRINAAYQQRIKIAPENTVDPFCMACYKIIGRCELSKRSLEHINQSMEDWVWLQFNLAREVNRVEDAAGEAFGLEELRSSITDIGNRHFTQGSEGVDQHGVFFWLQILAGMFERAVDYLFRYNYVAAVHFSIALVYYGLLRVGDSTGTGSEILTLTTKQQPQINFAVMIGHYTRDFRAARPVAAADYLTLICLNSDLPGQSGHIQVQLCHEALRELVLETREFSELLGDLQTTTGRKIKGAIEQRIKLLNIEDHNGFLKNITLQAAAMADDSGRITDAVLLYHLAEDYESVVSILSRALSEAVSIEIGQGPVQLQPLRPRGHFGSGQQQQEQQSSGALSLLSITDPSSLARGMIDLYDANAMYYGKVRKETRETLGKLLVMNDAKSLVQAGNWSGAIDHIRSIDLLPLSTHGNISAIRAFASKFNNVSPLIARNIGNLLMWTITCCAKHRELMLNSDFVDGNKREIADGLLSDVKDLMVFAGLVRYKLPPRVFETLAQAGQDAGL